MELDNKAKGTLDLIASMSISFIKGLKDTGESNPEDILINMLRKMLNIDTNKNFTKLSPEIAGKIIDDTIILLDSKITVNNDEDLQLIRKALVKLKNGL